MNSKLKTTLLTGFLFFILISSVKAQEKYDFAVLQFAGITHGGEITISYSNKPLETIKINKADFENSKDVSPALKQIAKMQNDGWELINIQILSIPLHIYHLRKKQQ